jgi:iron complex outermembrane receptor protein
MFCRPLLVSTAAVIVPSAWAVDSSPVLEEIVVTAQRREQTLAEVGIAVSAFSGQQIADMNLASSNELAQMVPNLNIAEPLGAGNQPAIFIRGIGLSDFGTNNSGPVGVYVDDLYVSSPSAQVFQTFDLARVEVLRGPQGTLYGRNTTGGAIKYISARPTDELHAEFRASYADYDTTRFEAAASGALGERIRGRLSAVKDDSDGFVRNTFDGSDRNGADALAFRGILEFDPTEQLNVAVALYGGSVDGPAASYRRQGVMEADGVTPCAKPDVTAGRCFDFFGFQTESDFFDVSENREPTLDVDNYSGSITARWTGATYSFLSVTGLQTLDKFHEEETDVNPIDYLFLQYGVESDTFTQEFQVSGESGSLQWIAGAFYLDETIDQDQTADLGREFRPLIESIDPDAYPGGFDPEGTAIGVPALFARVKAQQKLESVALYGQGSYSLTESFDAVLGLRYTDETKDFRQQPTFVEPTFVVPVFDYRGSMSDSNLSGKAALEYSPDRDLLVYGSISTGFKAGGFNGDFLFDINEQKPYDPETITAYELGLKSTWLDGALRMNAAVFYNSYSDMQLFRIEEGTSVIPLQVLDNAGKAVTQGIELEFAAVPVEGLDLQLSIGLLDTELTEYVTDAGEDLSGNRLAQSPEVSASGILNFERPLGDSLTLISALSFSFQDDVYFTANNDPALRQDAYWLANLRLGLRSASGRWQATLFCANVFDEEYVVHGFDLSTTMGSNQLMLGRPRTAGIEVSLHL